MRITIKKVKDIKEWYRRKSTWFTLKDATDACKEFIKENWLKKEYRDTP